MVKRYSLYCAGENVGGMAKGKAAMYKGGVLMILDGIHGELEFAEGTATPMSDIVAQIADLSKTSAENIVI